MTKDREGVFTIRTTPEERKEWEWAADVIAEETQAPANVSAFLRAAAKEKVKRLKEARKGK